MRYELTDHEWTAIKPFLPNKPRGVPRVNDHRVLNGIFWVLRSGAPWRDLPQAFGPYTTRPRAAAISLHTGIATDDAQLRKQFPVYQRRMIASEGYCELVRAAEKVGY